MLFALVRALVILLAFNSMTQGNYHKDSKLEDPPCFFNPLCTCSKAFPDLGRVTCKDTPLLIIPQQINTSKVFMLHMQNNGLRYIEPHFFRHTGLFRIEISQNFLTDIGGETFAGLEISLWELNLQRNRFKRVPDQSLRSLQKLKLLDLSENEITNVKADDWLGLEHSLKTLILRGNKLSTLRPRTFSILRQLESLDLSGNALFEFDGSAFKDGPPALKELYLADNLLSSIPLQELSDLRHLRHLDLSFNQITEIQDLSHDRSKSTSARLFLDTLHLDYNQIEHLAGESFKSFPTLNRTYFNGNPIKYVEKNAFRFSKIREVYFKDCEISELTADAFSGLQNFLEILDLEGNNLTFLTPYLFKDFTSLRSLNLGNNYFKEIDFTQIFGEPRLSLEHLDLTGMLNAVVDFQRFDGLKNLRSIAFSKVSQPSLAREDIPDFLIQLEDIKISYSSIKNLKSHAFKNVRGLRRLDLTENSISAIEDKAFDEIGHSLFYLSLANGLSPSVTQLPARIFEDLTAVELLDISNNKLKVLSQNLFHSMKRLRTLLVQDNFIEFIPKRMFQGDIHSELHSVQLSFNQMSAIESQTFTDLSKLEYLWLNDNKITKIETKAFTNLPKLKCLYLEGNKISSLKEESFQDLPHLEKLDLAYNKIKTFGYDFLDQVGTLSSFSLNLSHNAIDSLMSNLPFTNHSSFAGLHVNIKALDLSHNNISFIGSGFFRPIQSSATHVYLSHNRLRNVTKNVFGSLMHLQWLDLSHNMLMGLESDAFTDTKNIQVLYLSNNRLQEVPRHFLKDLHHLRILDLRSNELRSLPHNLFSSGQIERLDVSRNQLSVVPIRSFDGDSALHLSELDLSENEIDALPSADAFAIFKNLHQLNLSKNRLLRIEDGTFSFLHRLHVLDLSHNADLNLDSKGLTFHGLENVLEELILKNLSLNAIPALRLNSLKSLDVSGNDIFTVPYELSHNLSRLEKLEFSNNKMVSIPPGVTALPKLHYLGLSGNPLESINFQQSFSTRELDLRNTSLGSLEKGALGKLPLLEILKITINDKIQNLNIPRLLKDNYGLSQLYIEVPETVDFMENKLKGTFSPKLQNLTLVGRGLKAIPRNLLQGIQSPQLNLVIFNTSVQEIAEEVFENAEKIRNLTLDVRSNKLRTVFNPNTGLSPNTPKKLFLLDLKISDNDWICDCWIGRRIPPTILRPSEDCTNNIRKYWLGIRPDRVNLSLQELKNYAVDGNERFLDEHLLRSSFLNFITEEREGKAAHEMWMEGWERKKRQYLCEDYSEDCFSVSDDLRNAVCSNRKPDALIEVFKRDLECGWNHSRNLESSTSVLTFGVLLWFVIAYK